MPTDYAIKNGRTVMDATTYTGTGSSASVVNAGGFKPDLVWVKNRNSTNTHNLTDSVRGVSKILNSATTAAELDDPTYFVTAFNSNGFTQAGNPAVGSNGNTYVAWQWQAGQGTTSSNTNGSITSTVSANTTAGFSIVQFTMPAVAGITVGHGLGVAPSMYIVKSTATTSGWATYHKSLGAGFYTTMNTTAAAVSDTNAWNNTAPTSSVFTIGTSFNGLAGGYIGYCWAQVAGFSQFDSYTGNGSADGPFVYTGFRPKFLLFKQSSAAGEYWHMMDSTRSPDNAIALDLYPNLSNAEATYSPAPVDFLSNGFKFRTSNGAWNGSGATYIYMAFAENPFKYANAR